MPRIELEAFVAGPPERVFDLSRSIDLHMSSNSRTGEQAVAGVTSGLINEGEEVTWRAKHLGVRQFLTVRIAAMNRPTYFRDQMVRGAFRGFTHAHHFTAVPGGTMMRDVFEFQSPLGPLGQLANWLFLTRYMRKFLKSHQLTIRKAAETEQWRRYLPGEGRGDTEQGTAGKQLCVGRNETTAS